MKVTRATAAFAMAACAFQQAHAQADCEEYAEAIKPQCYAWTQFAKSLNQGEAWTKCKSLSRNGEDPCSRCPADFGFVQCVDGFLTEITLNTENGLSVADEVMLQDAMVALSELENFVSVSVTNQAALNLELCFDECDGQLTCTFGTGCSGDCLLNGGSCNPLVTESPTVSASEPTSAPTVSEGPVEATPSPTTGEASTPAPTAGTTSAPTSGPPPSLRTGAPTASSIPVVEATPSPTTKATEGAKATSAPTSQLPGSIPTETPTHSSAHRILGHGWAVVVAVVATVFAIL